MTHPKSEEHRRSGFTVGDSFSRGTHLDAESIRAFAVLVGDTNPLHHDVEAAAAFGLPGLIASGLHTSSLMMGFVADYMTERGRSLGLEITSRFHKPVLAGTELRVEWTITQIEPKPSLRGSIVFWSGKLLGPDGQILATGSTKSVAYG